MISISCGSHLDTPQSAILPSVRLCHSRQSQHVLLLARNQAPERSDKILVAWPQQEMESEWGSHHRVIKDHHRSARYLSQIKSKPMPGHFAWDSNLSTIHLKYLSSSSRSFLGACERCEHPALSHISRLQPGHAPNHGGCILL